MTTTVSCWGNSLAVRIPATAAGKVALKEGDNVELSPMGPGKLIIEAVHEEIDFDALYERITPENRHAETAWGDDVGSERSPW
jgi:antitoxin component of MazEF toxin-antitoxin module